MGEAVSLRGRGLDQASVPAPPQSSPVESEEEEPEEQDWEEDAGEGPPVFRGRVGAEGGWWPAVPGKQDMSFLPSPPSQLLALPQRGRG